jgi:hypothetical protein
MSACFRFDEETLARLEGGLALDDHFSTCPDCLAARQAYERIQAGIRSLGGDQTPAEGWEGRVWQRIRDRDTRSRPRVGWWLTVPVAAALVAAVFLGRQAPVDPGLSLAVRIDQDAREARRGGDARPGDRLTVSATLPPARYAQVRVYQNESRLLCETSVQSDPRRPVVLRATCLLESAGRYQILALTSDQPLPATLDSPDHDAGAALAMGARVKLGPDIHVQ